MRFTTDPHTFADSVGFCARTIPARPQMPVLAGMLMTVANGVLALHAFDFETSTRATLDVVDAVDGTAIVSGRLLDAVTRNLPAQPVHVTLDGSMLHLICGRFTTDLPTFRAMDYPQLPDMPELAGTVGSDVFAEAVRSVAVAVATDQSLAAMTCIHVTADGDTLKLAATDKYRLAVRRLPWSPVGQSDAIALVPGRVMVEAARSLCSSANINIAFNAGSFGSGVIGFEGERRRTTSRLIDGSFPPFERLFPTKFAMVANVNVEELSEAVRRVAVVLDAKDHVRLQFDVDEVTVVGRGIDSASAHEALSVDYNGAEPAPMVVAVNPAFLQDTLGSLDSDEATFSIAHPHKPMIVMGKNPDLRTLLMPIRAA